MTGSHIMKRTSALQNTQQHRRTGRCGILAIATWAAWFWAAQGRLLTKKKEGRKGQKGCFNMFATAGLRTQSAPAQQGNAMHHNEILKIQNLGPIIKSKEDE